MFQSFNSSTFSSSSSCSSISSSKAPISKKKGSLDIQYIINSSKGREQWENIEDNINEWLDEQNIFIVDPYQKQQEYFQSQKNFAFEELQRDDSKTQYSQQIPTLQEFNMDIKANQILERRSKFTFSNFF